MSKYNKIVSELGGLDIYNKSRKSSHSTSHSRQYASSSGTSSRAPTSSPATTPRSPPQTSSQTQLQGSSAAQSRVGKRPQESDEEDEEDDDDSSSDDDEDDRGRDGNKGGAGGGGNPSERNSPGNDFQWRLAEILSSMSNEPLTPGTFHTHLNQAHPGGLTDQSQHLHSFGWTLLRELSNQARQTFLNRFNRAAVIQGVVEAFRRRLQIIEAQLHVNLRDVHDGRDVGETVADIKTLQDVMWRFMREYGNYPALLTNAVKDEFALVIIALLQFIRCGDDNLYVNTQASRRPYASDTAGGNLYVKWNQSGDPGTFFQMLNWLRGNAWHVAGGTLTEIGQTLAYKDDTAGERFRMFLSIRP